MANKTKKTPATPKKRSTKYSKLAAVCSKELAAKKKALVLAEKRLAKAARTHQELLAEVARLDMLDRSLKAVNEGLEPPQNIKYVYTYPTWIWQSYPNQWWYPQYNNGNYTISTTGTRTTGYLQGGFQGGLQGVNCVNTVNTMPSYSSTGVCYTSNSGSLASTTNVGLESGTGSIIGLNSSGIENQIVTNSGNADWSGLAAAMGKTDLTVDLSTGATEGVEAALNALDTAQDELDALEAELASAGHEG